MGRPEVHQVKNKKELSVHQTRVVKAFKAKNTDIPIAVIYLAVYGNAAHNRLGNTPRKMQQKLAPTFAAINVKIGPDERIEPGEVKQTYRYSTKHRG